MAEQQQQMQAQQPEVPTEPENAPDQPQNAPEQELAIIDEIMKQYQVPENVARAMREGELMGLDDEGIAEIKDMLSQEVVNNG